MATPGILAPGETEAEGSNPWDRTYSGDAPAAPLRPVRERRTALPDPDATLGVSEPERLPSATMAELDDYRVPVLPRIAPSLAPRFEVLQKWEGTVLSVLAQEFSASLRDLTDTSKPEEQASFDLADVSVADRAIVSPGAVFYWAIGYETRSGQRSRVSRIRFRMLPRWTERDLTRLRGRAAALKALFGGSER